MSLRMALMARDRKPRLRGSTAGGSSYVRLDLSNPGNEVVVALYANYFASLRNLVSASSPANCT